MIPEQLLSLETVLMYSSMYLWQPFAIESLAGQIANVSNPNRENPDFGDVAVTQIKLTDD